VRLNAAEFGILFAKLNGLDAELRKKFGDVRARFGDKMVGEKIAVAVNDAKRRRRVFDTFHNQGFCWD